MRLSTVSIVSLAGIALILGTRAEFLSPASAAPPPPPAEFAQPESSKRPAPFPAMMVDQGMINPQFKGYFLPEGFRMEVVLSEPDIINPVGMTFGPDGTMFVLEWRPDPINLGWNEVKETVRYRDNSTRTVATMKKFTMDTVKMFRFNVGTGKYDPAKVIIAEELPSSILYHDGWLYLSGRGTVKRYRQAKVGAVATDKPVPASPNDPWSIREVIAQGFCGFHHHQVSGMTIGNDGWLYITTGDDDNVVEGSDGSRATVLRTGAVFRCKPDGSKMEVFSQGYRNPYRDLAFDDRFNWFHADNDNEDGSRFTGCRIMHVTEGSDFGWRLREGARCCRPDNARAAVGGELPGKLPPMIKTGRGSPAGLMIYNDTFVPKDYRGLLYYPDVYRKLIRAYKVEPTGSTYKISGEMPFMQSEDPLFRPCQMVTGPDGAIYVCDWRTDSGGAGKLWGDGLHGRIYRIKWTGAGASPALPLRGMDSWANIAKLPDEQLADALFAPTMSDRIRARDELIRRGDKTRNLVLARFISGHLPDEARLPALGVLVSGWNADVENLFRLQLNDESADVRRLVADGLARNSTRGDPQTFEALLKILADREPAVRRVAALSLGRLGNSGAADALVNAWRFDEHADAVLRDSYLRGLELLGKPAIASLLSLANSGDKECALAVEAFLALRTQLAADAIPQLLANPHLTPAERESLIRSYSNYQFEPAISLEPLAEFLAARASEPIEVVRAVTETLVAGGASNAPKATQLILKLLVHPELDVRLAALAAVEEGRMTAASPRLLEMLADASRSQAERTAIVKGLRGTGDPKCLPALVEILKAPVPGGLKIEALRTLSSLAPDIARSSAEPLLDQADAPLVAEAVAALSTSKAGAKLIAERYLAKRLPRDLFPQVTDALKKFGDDPDLTRMRADVMRGGLLLSLEPGQVEKVRLQVINKGDPKKGKELFLNIKLLNCLSCHRMEGIGGAVGPDLTRVWDTHTVEKLVESIADPSKEIKEGYQAYRALTLAGQVIVGLKVSETSGEVVLRDPTGRDVRLLKDDIEQITATKTSLMPDDAAARLTYDQFIDVLAFLKSKKEQESLRGLVVEYRIAGPFPTDLRLLTPEIKSGVPADEKKWLSYAAEPNGTVDVKGAFPATPAGVYARAFVYSPKKQPVTGTIQSEDPLRVWVGDASVFDRADPNFAAGPTSEETFGAELQPGWNVVLMKVVNAGRAHRVGLRFSGEGLRTAAMPDATVPPGLTPVGKP